VNRYVRHVHESGTYVTYAHESVVKQNLQLLAARGEKPF
jgi:tRNA U34 5-methylaminomethyl-2-thiouridine-forming methyltransferase MnmC